MSGVPPPSPRHLRSDPSRTALFPIWLPTTDPVFLIRPWIIRSHPHRPCREDLAKDSAPVAQRPNYRIKRQRAATSCRRRVEAAPAYCQAIVPILNQNYLAANWMTNKGANRRTRVPLRVPRQGVVTFACARPPRVPGRHQQGKEPLSKNINHQTRNISHPPPTVPHFWRVVTSNNATQSKD